MNTAAQSADSEPKPFYRFILHEDCEGRFLAKASIKKHGEDWKPLNLQTLDKQPSFRAIFILMLLAKFKGAANQDGQIKFEVPFARGTWIYTLVNFLHDNNDGIWFNQKFGWRRFFVASRGNLEQEGDVPPSVDYLAHVLPAENLAFFLKTGKGDIQELMGDGLLAHAIKLEAESMWKRRHAWNQEQKAVALSVKATVADDGTIPHEFNFNSKSEKEKLRERIHRIVGLLTGHCSGKYVDEEVEAFLKEYPSLVNAPLTNTGETILQLAVLCKRSHIVEDTLAGRKDINVNCRNNAGVTPLLRAIRQDSRLVEVLLKNGADVHACNDEGANAIYEAAFSATSHSLEVIKQLSSLGVPCNILCRDGSTPLSVALSRKAPDEVIHFLMDARTQQGATEIHYKPPPAKANSASNEERLKELYQLKALASRLGVPLAERAKMPIEPSSDTLKFFKAVRERNVNEVKKLLSGKSSINVDYQEPYFGRSALHEAVENFSLETVRLLSKAESNPFLQDHHGRTPLELLPPESEMKTENPDRMMRDRKHERFGLFQELMSMETNYGHLSRIIHSALL